MSTKHAKLDVEREKEVVTMLTHRHTHTAYQPPQTDQTFWTWERVLAVSVYSAMALVYIGYAIYRLC